MVVFIGLISIALAVGGAAGDTGTVSPDTVVADTTAADTESFLVYETAPPMMSQTNTPVTTKTLQNRVEPTQTMIDNEIDEMAGVTVHERFWIANVIRVEINTDRVNPDTIANINGVDRVTPDATVALAGTATATRESNAVHPSARQPAVLPSELTTNINSADTLSGSVTGGLAYHQVLAAWATGGTRGSGARIAVLDTGVNESYPDINLAADGWVEFTANGTPVDSAPYDSDGHETHVSGTTTGGSASGTTIGVAPDATLYHAKVSTENELPCFAAE